MLDKEEILEEITRCYYNWFNHEREWIRTLQENKTVEALTAELKKAEEMGKVAAFVVVLGDSKVVFCKDCIEMAWARLSPKARRELREECLRKDKELNRQGALWYSWLILLEET